MTERSTIFASFTLERTYPAPVARVWHAFADIGAKTHWFGGPSEWTRQQIEFDFRVGGRESVISTPPGGEGHRFDAVYHDLVEGERIVYSYAMMLGERRISVSLATITMRKEGGGTRLVLTEQGVFFDGYDDAGSREHGTRGLLDKLGAWLSAA